MNRFFIVLRYTLGLLLKVIFYIFLYPFSRAARHKLSNAFAAISFPYYGNNCVELSELLANDELKIILAPVKSNRHNTSVYELTAIASIVKDNYCNQIFEIGTFDGRTTRAMALNLQNENGKIYTLNLPPDTAEVFLETGKVDIELASKVISGERFLNSSEHQLIEQLWGDSAKFDYTLYHGKMDLVFIDGAHSETYVANDTKNALSLIKNDGGWIMWHDAPYFGVVKFLKKWIPKQNGRVYFIKGTSLALAYVKQGSVTLK